jgi:hypothetical protein
MIDALLANRTRQGGALGSEDFLQLSSSTIPIAAAGLRVAVRLARTHKPTAAQQQAARDVTARLATAPRQGALALLRPTAPMRTASKPECLVVSPTLLQPRHGAP